MALDDLERDNLPRWHPQRRNFFESYVLSWNDPRQKIAGWLRYSLLAPAARDPEVTLSGFFFDSSDPTQNRDLQETVPIRSLRSENEIFYFATPTAAIYQTGARGELKSQQDQLSWELKLQEPIVSLRHFPKTFYQLPWPSTKLVAPHLSCRISGEFTVNQKKFSLDAVPGHQAHLWGTARARRWVWGHCNSFEDPSAVFEGFSVSDKLTLLFFVYQGKRYSFLSPWHWSQNKSLPGEHRWHFESAAGEFRFIGDLFTDPKQMMTVRYEDPDGTWREARDTKVADLKIQVLKKGRDWELVDTLTAQKSAAFEVVR